MWLVVCRALGVTPDDNKTGKREAAWALIAIAIGLTAATIALGPDTIDAMSPVLIAIWPSAITYLGYAYKLENDRRHAHVPREGGEGWPEPRPPGEWERDEGPTDPRPGAGMV